MSAPDAGVPAYIAQLEEALAASEERYRALFDDDTAGRFTVDSGGRIFDANPSLAKLLGFDAADQVLGRNLRDFLHEGNRAEQLLATAKETGRVDAAELALTRSDGDPITVVMWLRATFAADRSLVAVHGRLFDVTEFERLKVRLLGARRMEAIGRLTGGIAHEFNNLLSVIDGHAERLVDTLAPGHPLANSALAIQKAARRAGLLTRQLLAFGRRQVFQWRIVAPQQLIAGTRTVLERLLGESIELRLDLSPEAPDIRADPAQLEQIVVILAVNAREAMPTGGRFTIYVDVIEVGGAAGEERPWIRPGRHVRLRIADTGVGMDAATKARVFEPFFTTKRIGDGIGLGLATVYGIVKQSGGYIWVESEVGRGTTFTLLFPTDASASQSASSQEAAASYETILIVESDEGVREVMVDSLRRFGYRVLDAANPAVAREIVAAYGSRVHLLVCEIDGEDESGAELARRLKAEDPLVQILYLADGRMSDAAARLLAGRPFLEKPFTQRALSEKVRHMLDSGEGR